MSACSSGCSVKFEDHVKVLCAEALGTQDEAQVRRALAELRLVLHQRIEQLRSALQSGYAVSLTRGNARERQSGGLESGGRIRTLEKWPVPMRTWQKIVTEITVEQDAARASQLSKELNRLLQEHVETERLHEDSA